MPARFALALALALTTALTAASPALAGARCVAHRGARAAARQVDAQFAAAINRARTRRGVGPLQTLPAVAAPARDAIVSRCAGTPNARATVRAWLASRRSRGILLRRRYRVVAVHFAGRTLAVRFGPAVTGSGDPALTAQVPAGATWFSTFDDANPWSKWEGYRQPLQLLQGGVQAGQLQTVDAASQGVPAPPGFGSNTHVLLAQVSDAQFHQYADNYPRSYCCVQAKLFHGWGGTDPGNSPQLQPGQEAGSYRAWYYLPPDTPTYPVNSRQVRWVNLMQWKSAPIGSPGSQFVNTEADLLPVAGKVWLCFAGGWGGCYPPSGRNAVRAPLGRWFELRADFHHSGTINWYVDGRPVWTTRNVRTLQPGQLWIFGIGHYGGEGRLYAKTASFVPGA